MKFDNKYEINGELLVMTALHIGSGLDDGVSDAPCVKLSKNGSYYIPGSSFRGYLRTKMERYVSDKNEYIIFFGEEQITKDDVNDLFGYVDETSKKSKSTKIYIQDMMILTDTKKSKNSKDYNEQDITSVKRDGIKISRKTGTTEDGTKFDYDVITRGNIFDFKITVENATKKQLSLLFISLNEIFSEDGDLIGGKTSRGIGRCRVENVSLKYVESKELDSFKNFLLTNTMINKDIKEFKENLFSKILLNNVMKG